jgi:LCP family protein required for cell wall assembly
MNCSEARKLLDAHVTPGPGDPIRTQLGFHLSGCAACRAYRQRADPLLSALLADVPAPAPPPAPAARRRPRRLIWPGLALAALALLGWWLSPTLLALATIGGNLAAISEASEPIPTAPAPSLLPSATPQPVVDISAKADPARALAGLAPTATPSPTAESATPSPPPPSPTAPRPAGSPQAAAERRAPLGAEPTDQPTPQPVAAFGPPPPPILLPTIVAPERFLPVVAAVPEGLALPSADTLRSLSSEVVTILLLGSDRRPSEGGPARTDAIAIAYIDLARGRVALLSLPRDLVVEIPAIGYARINAAAVYGELNPQLGGGRELARRTVENLLGLPISYVVEADFMGFIAAVDALGGVTIDVPQALYDPAYPTMDYGYQEISFAPGPQQMDGATALIYGRTRHGDSDFGRMTRQQAILLALIDRVRGQNLFEQIESIASVTSALRGFVRTDMPEDRMVGLAWAMRGIDPAAVSRLTLTRDQVASNVVPEDPYALFALPGTLEGLVEQLLGL